MSDGSGLVADPGSFRDSVNRVYASDGRILRGMDAASGTQLRSLIAQPFFSELLKAGSVVGTRELDPTTDSDAQRLSHEGWSHVFEHDVIPFVSYPYEWSFSMLRDAALLQLDIVERCMENGWTLKDASPYNIQWQGPHPVFIDAGSFEPWKKGEPWIGYRQFCSMFLIPLMLKAHLAIDYLPLLRSRLDGITPTEAARYFRGARFKAGVMSHVLLPAAVENSIARKERDRAPAAVRRAGNHSKAMVLGLIQGLQGLVRKLKRDIQHTDWSQYAKTHSYEDADFIAKQEFVRKHVGARPRRSVWDVGCNTGTFSKLSAEFSEFVLALDGDHDAIEQLYASEKASAGSRILPMVMDLANISPNQGWAGLERKALDNRRKPDVVLCLALIHHMRVSANIPIPMFLDWLRRLGSEVVIEFVNREDEMFVKLLANKTVAYEDYTLENFVRAAGERYEIKDRHILKGGHRELFFLAPRQT